MSSPAKLTLPIPAPDWLKRIGLGVAFGGPASVVALAMVDKGAIGAQAVAQVIAWGPGLVILLVIYALVERWAPRVVAAQNAQATASRDLAVAVQQQVERGDRDMRETQLMLKYTAQGVERLHDTVNAIREEMRAYAKRD